jgi:hypothetical protein
MKVRICLVLYFGVAISVAMGAQEEPGLVSANLPRHPALACQARIEGSVKLRFTLAARAVEPTMIEAVWGNAMLKGAAVENLNTWLRTFIRSSAGTKQRSSIGFPRPARKRSRLNRGTA